MAEHVMQVIVQELRRAPREARQKARIGVATVCLGVGFIAYDVASGTYPGELFRLGSLLLALAGIGLLVLTQALHAAGRRAEREGTEDDGGSGPALLHRVHRALPAVAIASAMLLSAAAAMMLPFLLEMPLVIVPAVLIGAFAAVAAQEATGAARFLYGEASAQAEAAAAARAEAAEARLAALQAQLDPHFLFNALNTVASLVRRDAQAAEETIESLARVLRRTLERSQAPYATVAEEIEFVRAYLTIEERRFGDRLQVAWEVAEPAREVRIPCMTLQPLVENALKHGIGQSLEGGWVRIAVATGNGQVCLSVADSGPGFPRRFQDGTGLGNLRRRLQALYGERARLRTGSVGTGARVTVELPVDREATR